MLPRALRIALAVGVVALGLSAAGCEKTTHQNIDKWVTTQKGGGKLKAALEDTSIDPDLSAHAAIAMLRRPREMMDSDVRRALDKMPAARRAQVIPKLVPRLWDLARVENESELPDPLQTIAKDLLVQVRPWADDTTRQQIDVDLTDWYGVRSYIARAKAGSVQGPAVVRLIGAPLGAKLIGVAQAVIAAPGQEVQKNKIDDQLMIGIAIAGSPEGVKFVLDLVHFDRGDKTLPGRAVSALYRAYINSDNEFDLQAPDALRPNVDAIAAIAKDEASSNGMIMDAIALIRAAGAPVCTAPLNALVGAPHSDTMFKYAVGSAALQCSGPSAIGEVVKSFPPGSYEQGMILDNLVREIAKLEPKDQVLAAVRQLAAGPSTFAKWVAIETIAFMHDTADAGLLTGLATSKEPLSGFWGENTENKPTPTLGQRATELAATLK